MCVWMGASLGLDFPASRPADWGRRCQRSPNRWANQYGRRCARKRRPGSNYYATAPTCATLEPIHWASAVPLVSAAQQAMIWENAAALVTSGWFLGLTPDVSTFRGSGPSSYMNFCRLEYVRSIIWSRSVRLNGRNTIITICLFNACVATTFTGSLYRNGIRRCLRHRRSQRNS